jgi:spermidine/putrescine transport system substrate-binding protein
MTNLVLPRASRRKFLKGAAAVGLTFTGLSRRAWAEEEKQLNFYNWDTYIGATTIDTFTEKTGIAVQTDFFANNEELLAKLKQGNPGYDVIVPSDYMVATMITLGIVNELDDSQIPNKKNVDPTMSNPAYDPNLKHCVPYMFGTLGIGYRKSKVETPTSWADVLDSDKYAGRIALLADQRVVLGIALHYLGYSMNTTNPDEINKARDLLIKQKKNLKAFAPDEGQNMLAAGDVDIVMEWNGDILQVSAEDDDLAYAIPNEGTNVFVDNMCVPKDGPHPSNAHAFINHINDPTVNAEICTTINYATANIEARKLLPPETLSNPAIYPSPEIIAKSEQILDVGEATTLYDEAWTQVQAA